MKKSLSIPCMLFALLSAAACGSRGDFPFPPDVEQPAAPDGGSEKGDDPEPGGENVHVLKIVLTVNGRTVTATLEDHAAGRDFVSRLPFEATLNDFNGVEKIFYPSPALSLEGVPRGCTPSAGDITIYTPWNNVAIFCKSGAYGNALVRIGRIDGNGYEALLSAGSLHVRFERL